MRQRLNLDMVDLDRVMMLIHGPYGGGKTHLQGDFLQWAKERGPIAFVNIAGEDGYASLTGMGLGDIAETVETLKDYDDLIADYAKRNLAGVAFDSLPALEALIIRDITPDHELRYPDPKLDGERAKMMWGQIKMRLQGRVTLSRAAGKVVLWVSAYDRSSDAITNTGSMITPNLIGKTALGCAGWFNFVGSLIADTAGPNKVTRRLTFAPSTTVLTRQRVAKTITQTLTIPEGAGGWRAVWAALESAMPTLTPKEQTCPSKS